MPIISPNNSTALNSVSLPTQTTPFFQGGDFNMLKSLGYVATSWWSFFQSLFLRVKMIGTYRTATAINVSLVTGTAKTITSLSLPPGNWLVQSSTTFSPAATTQLTLQISSISNTTNLVDSTGGRFAQNANTIPAGIGCVFPTPLVRLTLDTQTTIYAVALANFTVSTCTASATLTANAI